MSIFSIININTFKTLLNLSSPTPMAPGQRWAPPTWQGDAPPASQLFTDSQVQLARAGGFVQQQQQKEQVNGRQAEVGSCTAGRLAGRQCTLAAHRCCSLLLSNPRPGCAPAGRGYKTANCRKALVKAVFFLPKPCKCQSSYILQRECNSKAQNSIVLE